MIFKSIYLGTLYTSLILHSQSVFTRKYGTPRKYFASCNNAWRRLPNSEIRKEITRIKAILIQTMSIPQFYGLFYNIYMNVSVIKRHLAASTVIVVPTTAVIIVVSTTAVVIVAPTAIIVMIIIVPPITVWCLFRLLHPISSLFVFFTIRIL